MFLLNVRKCCYIKWFYHFWSVLHDFSWYLLSILQSLQMISLLVTALSITLLYKKRLSSSCRTVFANIPLCNVAIHIFSNLNSFFLFFNHVSYCRSWNSKVINAAWMLLTSAYVIIWRILRILNWETNKIGRNSNSDSIEKMLPIYEWNRQKLLEPPSSSLSSTMMRKYLDGTSQVCKVRGARD